MTTRPSNDHRKTDCFDDVVKPDAQSGDFDWLIAILTRRTIPVVTILVVAGGIALWLNFYRVSSQLNASTASFYARLYSEALADFRSLYSSEVVSRVQAFGMRATHDYRDHSDAIPLPATLSMELGRRIGTGPTDGQTRLYSDYPFPWQEFGGPTDAFEREALTYLRQHPDEPFVRVETVDGTTALRYATADRMHPSCVACHNTYAGSPKTDWKTNDVRGVLEVILPLANIEKQTKSALKEIMAIMATIVVVGLGLLGIVINGLRTTSARAQQSAEQTRRINDSLKVEIENRRRTETALAAKSAQLEATNKQLQSEIADRKAAQEQINSALKESERNRDELEQFNQFAVNRELNMVDLKREINQLHCESGRSAPYDLSAVDEEGA